MARPKSPPNKERNQITIRFDPINERWLRLRAMDKRRSLADEINEILATVREGSADVTP